MYLSTGIWQIFSGLLAGTDFDEPKGGMPTYTSTFIASDVKLRLALEVVHRP